MQIEVPVKTEADTLAVVQAYAHINTPNKVVAKALAIRRLTRFHKCSSKALPTLTRNATRNRDRHATRNRV